MHKTKPISKTPHPHKPHQHPHSPPSPQSLSPPSPVYSPPPLEFSQLGEAFTIDDFMRSLQMEEQAYYISFLPDPYFDHDADPPTAPLRTRPCIHRINQQYMARMGPLPPETRERRVQVRKEVRVVYFKQEDEANKIGDCQEYAEEGEQGVKMEGESME